jgi:gas vesicle protein
MADSKLRICATCRQKYHYCPRCRQDADKPYFYFTFCSENCKDIYNVTSSFEDGRISASEAKAQLDKLDLSKSEKFGESYKNSIAKIYAETIEVSAPIVEEILAKTEEEFTEVVEEVNTTADEVSDEVEQLEENIEEEKPRNYRRSKKKTVDDVE